MDGAGFEERGRAERPESKSHGMSFASKVTQRRRPLEPRLIAICEMEALEYRGQPWWARYYLERRGYTATRRSEEDLKHLRWIVRECVGRHPFLPLPSGERIGVRRGRS